MKEKWYKHKPEVNKCNILWGFTVQTDHQIHRRRRPDVIVVHKDKNRGQIIDFSYLMMEEWVPKN